VKRLLALLLLTGFAAWHGENGHADSDVRETRKQEHIGESNPAILDASERDPEGDGGSRGRNDEERIEDARLLDALSEAVRRKEILPLWMVRPMVEARFGPQIIEIEIEREAALWIYEFKVIDQNDRLLEVYVDARDGRVRRVEND
jgi:uncharacterized membrane protein YkoI